jgi:predicted nucleic acid-binding protein
VKVVLDTVVLVRGLLDPFDWSGAVLFERTAAYEWVVSPEVVDEYIEVTKRPALARKFRTVAGRDLDAILDRLEIATLVQPNDIPLVCVTQGTTSSLLPQLPGALSTLSARTKTSLIWGTTRAVTL